MRTNTVGATKARIMLATLCWLAACDSGTGPHESSSSPFVVSNPIPGLSPSNSGANTPAASSSSGEVVFVSLPTGSIPNGIEASISNRRSAFQRVVPLVDGGMDPTAVPAAAGDILEVVVSLSGGGPLRFILTVPVRARPIVVRSNPPPHKRDVPLNFSLLIVFSEPIDAASLSGTAIQLRSGASTVAGQLQFGYAAHLSVVFAPAAPLSPLTDYLLVITPEVRDLSGEALEATVAIPFTTEEAGGLREIVSTEGEVPDLDGYVVSVSGEANRAIGLNEEASFSPLSPNIYGVTLSGLALNCMVLGPRSRTVSVEPGRTTQIEFRVVCPAVPLGSLLITVTTQFFGTGWPATFLVHVDDDADRSISANGYLVINLISPGDHTVTLITPAGGGSFCVSNYGDFFSSHLGTHAATVSVSPVAIARVSYEVTCIP